MKKRTAPEGSSPNKDDALLVFALEFAIPVITVITVGLILW
jgi:hypothetical protein